MRKTMIAASIAIAAALVACQASSQDAARDQARITHIGGDDGCGLYEVVHKGQTFYMATRRGSGSCALSSPIATPTAPVNLDLSQ